MPTEQIEVLADWGDVIAVSKPAGWLTIPGRGNKEGVPVLSHELGKQLRKGAQRVQTDLFVIHRLDEGTSGVILFARTPEAHRHLSMAFEGREIKKSYWCVVKGTPSPQTIDAPLFKLPSKKVKSIVDPKGKPSQTEIQPKVTQDGFTVVEALPLTGRSHQIRVHLSHIKCPLLGDPLYGGPAQAFGMDFKYPLLHSREITFEWPKGQKRQATAQLSGDFLEAAHALGFVSSCRI